MPSKSLSPVFSSSAKYLVMLTVECASVDASVHAAAAALPTESRTVSQDAAIANIGNDG
jgi:hypothetical protein